MIYTLDKRPVRVVVAEMRPAVSVARPGTVNCWHARVAHTDGPLAGALAFNGQWLDVGTQLRADNGMDELLAAVKEAAAVDAPPT